MNVRLARPTDEEKSLLGQLALDLEKRHFGGPHKHFAIIVFGMAKDVYSGTCRDWHRVTTRPAASLDFVTFAANLYWSWFPSFAVLPQYLGGAGNIIRDEVERRHAVGETVDTLLNTLQAFGCERESATLALVMLAFSSVARCATQPGERDELARDLFMRVCAVQLVAAINTDRVTQWIS